MSNASYKSQSIIMRISYDITKDEEDEEEVVIVGGEEEEGGGGRWGDNRRQMSQKRISCGIFLSVALLIIIICASVTEIVLETFNNATTIESTTINNNTTTTTTTMIPYDKSLGNDDYDDDYDDTTAMRDKESATTTTTIDTITMIPYDKSLDGEVSPNESGTEPIHDTTTNYYYEGGGGGGCIDTRTWRSEEEFSFNESETESILTIIQMINDSLDFKDEESLDFKDEESLDFTDETNRLNQRYFKTVIPRANICLDKSFANLHYIAKYGKEQNKVIEPFINYCNENKTGCDENFNSTWPQYCYEKENWGLSTSTPCILLKLDKFSLLPKEVQSELTDPNNNNNEDIEMSCIINPPLDVTFYPRNGLLQKARLMDDDSIFPDLFGIEFDFKKNDDVYHENFIHIFCYVYVLKNDYLAKNAINLNFTLARNC